MEKALKVLIPVDFSLSTENAINYAGSFLQKFAVEILMVHVYAPLVTATEIPVAKEIEAENRQRKASEEKRLNKVSAAFENSFPDLAVKSIVVEGDIPETLRKISANYDIDLILCSHSSEDTLENFLYGSTVTGIIEKSICPVLVIPQMVLYKEIKNIVYAAILTENDINKIQQLSVLAKAFNSTIHVITVEKKQFNSRYTISEFKKDVEAVVSYPHIQYHLVENDNVIKGIEDYIKHINADFLALNNHRRPFIFEKLYYGSISEQIYKELNVPLLIFHDDEANG